MRSISFIAALVSFTVLPVAVATQEIPSPEEHFGFAMGTDRKLARWDEILEYFTRVADASDRMVVDTVGPTTLGNPYVAVTLSSPANLARIGEIRAANRRLASGEPDRVEAEALADGLPATVFINHNIHSTEIASSQTSVDLVHRLATADDPVTLEILDHVVVVLVPSANPDGQIMVTDWYRRNEGTEFEKARMPWLYHHYAGHDNNRDFFQAKLVETRYWMDLMFRTAYAHVYLDQHQMGATGPRIFVPPYPDPMSPDVHPLQWQLLRFLGGGMVTDLQAAGKQGVVTGALYRIWGQEGALTGRFHNIPALLTESASATIASPVEVTRAELERSANRARDLDEYGFSMSFVDPWWGGTWRLGDIVEYQTIAAVSLLEQTARFKDRFILGRWQMAAETVEHGRASGPFAYVIPADQTDPVTAAELARTLVLQGVEVHRAEEDFEVTPVMGMRVPGEDRLPPAEGDDGEEEDEAGSRAAGPSGAPRAEPASPRRIPAGSWVVLAAQPSRAAVLDLLQPQARRVLREHPDGPYLRGYDGAAYTMPLQMGVESLRVDEAFDVELTAVSLERAVADAPALPSPRQWYALSTAVNRSYAVANELLARGVPVSRTGDHFLVPSDHPAARPALEEARATHGLTVTADPAGTAGAEPLAPSRVGLYQGWASSMDEGWTRLLLEEFGFDLTVLSNDDMRDADLGARIDIVVIPSEISLNRLLEGDTAGAAPPEFTGGIGDEGVENLKAFVRGGGTLITLDRGDEVVLKHFDVPVRDALAGVSDRDFFAPASLFGMELEAGHPLTRGSPAT
ncbi:MAG: M14 family metallopeptidase, partial [Gemmatimonadota bacterium]|nr:M14 family metallopeptidase [Gemmatimonadota bacterium]